MDVPEPLAIELMEVGDKYGTDMSLINYRMAFCIIRFYLGEDWADQKVRLQHAFDPFMLNELDGESDNSFTHMNRVEALGDALFRLRNCANFSVLCERFQNRNTKPCFTESQIANIVAKDGFHVEIVKESGVRGEDFDFIAHGASQDISVEVTAKELVPLTVATIRNTLQSKRSQVPSSRAAILYIIIPEEWTEDAATAESLFSEAIGNFFNGSKRFNAIVLVWVAALEIGEGRVFALTFRPYEIEEPRHVIDDTSFLHGDMVLGDLDTLRGRIKNDGANLVMELEDTTRGPYTSFYDWYLQQRQ